MPKSSKSKKLKLISITIAVVLLPAAILFALSNAGSYLVVSDSSNQKTDAAIILMGSIADRVLEASDYYKAGKTNKLIIVNNIQYGSRALEPYGVVIPNFARLTIDALLQLRVPDSAIRLLPGRATSTRDEADTLSALLISNPQIKSVSIISSSAHTRRAKMIFIDSFQDNGLEVSIVTVPSKYSEFNAQKWWTDRESAKQVFLEWVKIISFVTVEKWR
jgi:uncharacterized SAM-binding protein YcdF (DUF218 family)